MGEGVAEGGSAAAMMSERTLQTSPWMSPLQNNNCWVHQSCFPLSATDIHTLLAALHHALQTMVEGVLSVITAETG